MPATTRGSVNRELSPESTPATNPNNMASKKKELTLDDIFLEIKRGNKKNDDRLDEMDKKMDINYKVLQDYITSNDHTIEKLKTDVNTYSTKLTQAEATVTDLEDRMTTMSDELDETIKQCKLQQIQIDELRMNERARTEEVKKANIIIDGISEETETSLLATVTQMLTDIGVNIQQGNILTAFRLGSVKKVNKPRPRPILVKLSTQSIKFDIYKHVKNLRDSDKWKRIFISDDLPREIADERKTLRCLAATARDRGHRATVKGGVLVIDDIRYTYKEQDDLPEGVNMEDAKTIQVADGIAFQSHHSYLSSMYPTPIKIGDTPTNCAEQAYWFTMARTAGDKKVMKEVPDSKNGYEAKRAGHKLKMTKELEERQEENMEYVQDQKFSQNPALKSKLMVTKGNLYEATLDLFFGSGLLLAQKAKFGTVEQKGQNRLGLKLMDLRGKYRDESE